MWRAVDSLRLTIWLRLIWYTRPEHRRKHYGEHLIYQVTKKAIEAGYQRSSI